MKIYLLLCFEILQWTRNLQIVFKGVKKLSMTATIPDTTKKLGLHPWPQCMFHKQGCSCYHTLLWFGSRLFFNVAQSSLFKPVTKVESRGMVQLDQMYRGRSLSIRVVSMVEINFFQWLGNFPQSQNVVSVISQPLCGETKII